MASRKPDFEKANILANEILVASTTLVTFPVNTKQIVKEWSDIRVLSFKLAEEYEIDIEAFGSKSAVIQCKHGKYIIFYNQDDYEPRVKFSILHEFGHYRFGHKLESYADEEEYGRIEVEANCFAAQILMPEQVLNELKLRGARINASFLQEHFGVSEEAADKRIETFGKVHYGWRSPNERIFDDTILFKYKGFIDSIFPKHKSYHYEDEIDLQMERDSWCFDKRSRYKS